MFTSEPLPEDAVKLEIDDEEREFFAWVSPMTVYGAMLKLYFKHNDRVVSCVVAEVQKPNSWPRGPGTASKFLWRMRIQNTEPIGGTVATAFAMVVKIGAGMLITENEPLIELAKKSEEEAAEREADRRRRHEAWREQQRAARDEEERKQRDRFLARNARGKELYDHIKWLLEHQFRLTRDGKRSTVFGTIKSVSEPRPIRHRGEGPDQLNYADVVMQTVSERGKPMRIALGDINCFEVKYDGETRFNQIYPAP